MALRARQVRCKILFFTGPATESPTVVYGGNAQVIVVSSEGEILWQSDERSARPPGSPVFALLVFDRTD
jgi:hypothetical protein